MKISCKLILGFSQRSKFAMSLQYLKKEVRDEIEFDHAFKKVSYNLVLSLFMGMIKHSQSSQSNKFAISLEYLKKEFGDGVHFLHADKHKSFSKLVLLF